MTQTPSWRNDGSLMCPVIEKKREPVFAIALDLPRAGEGRLTEALHRQLRAAIIDGRLGAGFGNVRDAGGLDVKRLPELEF